jgi:leader peptidase (prepilin peptidase)/N-methyltransferase
MVFEQAAVFLFGLIIGSFLNVLIHRLPKGESLWKPGSRCPLCCSPIRPRYNIPLVSYFVLGGRCSHCHGKITFSYPLVEALGGVLAILTYRLHGLTPGAAIHFALLSLLLVIAVIDSRLGIIPDVLSLPGIVVSILASSFLPSKTWIGAVLGAVAGGGSLWAVARAYELLTGRQGMGGGDIKLLSLLGAALGWSQVPLVLFVASLAGSLYGLFLMTRYGVDRRYPLPFGPFLCMAGVIALFVGDRWEQWLPAAMLSV